MSTSAGPNIVEDGLVLSLDAANLKSFRGEPTTNVVTNTNLDTGWSKSYQTNIVFNEIDPPDYIDSQVVGFDRGPTAAYWYSYGNYAPQDPSVTYTVSLYVKTLDSNFNIKFYTADNSEVGRYNSEYINVPNDGKWHRLVWNSFTNAVDSQSDSLSFNFTYAGATGDPSTRTWFCAPQMEAKSYVTPFINGTRGTTVATGGGVENFFSTTGDGEIFGPIYSSAGKGSLKNDGVDDYIRSSNVGITHGTDNFAYSMWVNWDTVQFGSYFENGSWGNTLLIRQDSNTTIGVYSMGALRGTFSFTPVVGQWYNLGFVRFNNLIYFYLDGELTGQTVPFNVNVIPSTSYIFWGTSQHAITQNFNGKLGYISVYNVSLSLQQVKQNFNALRGRYEL
jgi:hypothetical protein